jgi:hypothetical protein
VLAVECGSRMGCDVKRSQDLAAFGIEGIQLFAGCEPDLIAVEADPATSSTSAKGPYSRMISAVDCFMSSH